MIVMFLIIVCVMGAFSAPGGGGFSKKESEPEWDTSPLVVPVALFMTVLFIVGFMFLRVMMGA